MNTVARRNVSRMSNGIFLFEELWKFHTPFSRRQTYKYPKLPIYINPNCFEQFLTRDLFILYIFLDFTDNIFELEF